MRIAICFFLFISSSVFASNEQTKLKITQLDNNVYQHISYKSVPPYGMVGASGLVVIDGNDAHIIDTPWTIKDTEVLAEWIKSKGFTLKSSVVTHFHEDASGGMPFFNNLKVKTFATPLTNSLLKKEKREPSSDEILADTFDIVAGTIEAFYPGAGHSQDNIVIWLPQAKILFGGCFVKNGNSKGLGYTGDASIQEWPQSIQNVLNKYPNIQVVVPGHGEVGDMSLLSHTAQLALSAKIIQKR